MSDAHDTRASLMGNSSFRWMLAGGTISMLGDQFTLIALPWLVLKMTGDSLALGFALAAVGLPVGIFILIGGALVDRHSPRRVLQGARAASTLLVGMLAILVLSHHATLSVVYALALGIGFASAFAIPSATSLLPHVVPGDHLAAANAITMGARQLTFLAGPLLAGALIAFAGQGNAGDGGLADARGLGLAFAVDAFSFAVSVWALFRVHPLREAAADPLTEVSCNKEDQHIWRTIGAGLAAVWNDYALRTCFIYWSLIALFMGTFPVALPMLANERLHSASAFGLLMGANGAGTLLGVLISGRFPRLRLGSFGSTVLFIDGAAGLLSIPLGGITSVWQGVALLLPIGVLAGFIQVAGFTWLQRRVPKAMLGRTMSIFMFIFMGMAPLSAAITGWLMHAITLRQLFAGSGALLALIALTAYLFSPMRRVTDTTMQAESAPSA